MPLAANMMSLTYAFGECILKEDEIPKGLYLIKSGQCKIAKRRIADRLLQSGSDLKNRKLGEKKKFKDRHPLFNEFDPDNSILNVILMSFKI